MNKLKWLLAISLIAVCLSPCLKDDEKDYTAWRAENYAYIDEIIASTDEAGNPEYLAVTPDWNPSLTIYIKWLEHGDGTRPAPFANSLCDYKYAGRLIDETEFDSSAKMTIYGEGIYRNRPNKMVPGFQAALTAMIPGDKITVVIPPKWAYGSTGSGNIKPYSTLIFDIELVDVVAYEKPF